MPHIEPPSRYGKSSPYEVLGKTYYVLPNPGRYREYGTASWYGAKFHGRLTSSGEPYDMYQLTAAHRSLPIPCYLRVTNLENQRSAIVRVNDRGPFHSERLIDLSYAAAVKLGFADRGVTRVMLELVDGTDDIPQTALADRDPVPAEPPAVAADDTSTPIAESSPGRIFSAGRCVLQFGRCRAVAARFAAVWSVTMCTCSNHHPATAGIAFASVR